MSRVNSKKMAEKKKPSKMKGLAKKAAVALATLGGIALLHKHSDKLPALMARTPRARAVQSNEEPWQFPYPTWKEGDDLSGKPSAKVGSGISQLKHRAQLQRLHLAGAGPMTALIDGGTLASDDYQNSVIEMHDRLKRLPDSSELKQDALKAGGSLLGMGLM